MNQEHLLIGDTVRVFPVHPNSLMSFDWNDYEIVNPKLPFASFGYAIKGELFEELIPAFKLWRLNNIKQLAFLRNPIIRENNPNIISMPFEHNRFDHSLDVGVLMALCVHQISEQNNQHALFDLFNTAFIAGCTHDTLTPAGGDTMKTVSDYDFDEDRHYPQMLNSKDCDKFCKKRGIDKSLLYDIILNKGFLGMLLNILDKVAYVSRDVYHYLTNLRIQQKGNVVKHSEGFYEILKLVQDNPTITSLWKNIIMKKGIPCFAGRGVVKKVADFMTLRALMFKHLYYHPNAQFPERALAWFVMKQIYNNGVTREDLLTHSDEWLQMKIDEFTGIPFFAECCLSTVSPKVELFKSELEARRYMNELRTSENHMCFYELFKSRTKNGLSEFPIVHKNKIVDLFSAAPERAEYIQETMTFPEVHRVYSFSLDPFSSDRKQKMLELQKKYA